MGTGQKLICSQIHIFNFITYIISKFVINIIRAIIARMEVFMGLTSSSTGSKLLNYDIDILKSKCDYTIAIARKSQRR